MAGKVYLVGAGPGDRDLITVKGLRCIQEADVIVYDRLINNDLLQEAKEGAEMIYCGKLPKHHTLQQETINHLLVAHAQKGKIVTRLKGGDPFIFGRGGEEALTLVEHNIPFEVVPGVTSGIAAPAYAGIPMTHREYSGSLAFLTGHLKAGDISEAKWEGLAKGVDTLAIYMGVTHLPSIVEHLVKYGKSPSTPIALIEWGTTPNQRTVTGTLETIVGRVQEEGIQNPAMIVIGKVVEMRNQIKWFEQTLPGEGQEV